MKITHYIRAFFRSSYYPFIIAALMTISEIFALELPVYYIYLILGACCIFFCKDTLGLMPIFCCSYMTFSYGNSLHRFGGTASLSAPANLLQFSAILIIAVILVVGRLVTCVIERPNKRLPALTFGFLALLVGYILAGVGFSGEINVGGQPVYMVYVPWKGLLYAFAQIIALSACYFYFFYTVEWESVKKSYLFTLFLAIGLGLLAEIGAMYSHEGVLKIENGVWRIDRDSGALITGWGTYNNVGCAMAMCIPAPFYFSVKNEKWGWAFSLLGCLFLLGVAFTQSRGSLLFGSVIFLACVVIVLVKAKGKNRILSAVVFGAMLLALIIAIVLFSMELGGFFTAIKETLTNILNDEDITSGRLDQYRESWEEFLAHPVLGVGFHNLGDGGFAFLSGSVLIPPRTHNTVLQLLASGGIVAFAAYLFHRAQTLMLWLRRPNFEKTMAACIIAVLLLTSLLDCHFFNYGPGLLYSCVLVYMECCADAGRSS